MIGVDNMNTSELVKTKYLKDYNIVKIGGESEYANNVGIVIGDKIIYTDGHDVVSEVIKDSELYYVDKIYKNEDIWSLKGIKKLLEKDYERLEVLYDREDYLDNKQIQLKDVELNKPFKIINSNEGKRIVKDEVAICVKPFDEEMVVYRDTNIVIPLKAHNEDLLIEYI